MSLAPSLPCILYDEELMPVAANAAARALLRGPANALPAGHWLRAQAPRPDPAVLATVPCSTIQTLPGNDAPLVAAVNYQRRAHHLAVRFAPIETACAFASQLLDPVLVTDRAGTLVYVNEAASAVVEFPMEAFIGQSALALGAALALEPAAVGHMLADALRGRGTLDDFALPTAHGTARHFVIRSSPWRFCDEICGTVWVAMEQPRLEKRDLALLTATSYRLAATYQHELRNPLQSVRAAVDLGRMGDDGRNSRVFEIIEHSVRTMTDFLADQALPWTDEPAEHCALGALIDDEIARACAQRQTAGLRIDHEQPARPGLVHVVPRAMARVFANLLLNAAAARGDATVRIRHVLADGQWVCTVEDDGPGFPPEALSVDWLRHADLRKHLGIAIVVATVEAHGGSVERNNAPHGGARVVIRLPLQTASPDGPEDA